MPCLSFSIKKPKFSHLEKKQNSKPNTYIKLPTLQKQTVQNEFLNTKLYKTRCNYIGRDGDELSFMEGDIVEVEILEQNVNLFRARHFNGTRIGYVSTYHLYPHSLYELKPWFFANITRLEAEDLLLEDGNIHGTFIVRSSMSYDHNPFSISIRSRNIDNEPLVKHYKIHKGPYGYYITNGITCDSLETLIYLYLMDSEGALQLHQRLMKPCRKPSKYQAVV